MGYARLTYPNQGTVPTTTVLYDIIGCVTGRFSSSAQLQGALTGSEIINTLGQNWNFTYPSASTFTGTNAGSASGSWVLTAPCVNSAKTKYIRLMSMYRNSGTYTLAPSGSGVSNLYTYGANPSGIYLQTCLSASNALTLVSASWYADGGTTATYNSTMLVGTNIIISWSSRHLIVWSDLTGGTNSSTFTSLASTLGVIEFPENDVTTAQNLTPVVYIIERNGNLNIGLTSYSPINDNVNVYGDILFPDFYNITTLTRAPASFRLIAASLDTSVNQWSKPITTVPTITSTGTNIIPFMPLNVNVLSRGFPYVHLSALSNLYIVPTGLGNGGDTIQAGSTAYAYLPSNTGMSFVVKKE